MKQHHSTRAVHAGEQRPKPFGAVTTPIVQTSTYSFTDTDEILDFMHAKSNGSANVRNEYGRYSNPTQTVAERKLADLDGGEKALLFASGMCAITTTMAALLSAGDHLLMAFDCYHRTRDFATGFLAHWGVTSTMVPAADPQALEKAISPETRLIFVETPTNPYLRIQDIEHVAALGKRSGITTMVDCTFATPMNLRPLEFGIDLVAHSATKYLGGHNDLLAGVVIGGRKLLQPVLDARGVMGGISNPLDAYLLVRGLKTLALRVQRQNENGIKVAQYLEAHPAVKRVYYPGLPSHPDYEVAQRQMEGHGGVVSFEIDSDFEGTGRFIDRLRLPYIGPTLGGVESIIEQPAALFSLDAQERKAAGLSDSLVRYALGIEDAEDIIADLDQALADFKQ
ncbi:MAG: aminotransferase class I/II-fold pyridoxal phosphate-dependent enzyme [Anaerolineales bacterium]|jgi:cystathionine gamma-synthase